MNIEEALRQVAEQPLENVLVAKGPPFTPFSEAVFVSFSSEGAMPDYFSSQGYEYLLEVEEIQFLLESIANKKMSRSAVAEYVVHYANYDAYPSWINDIPDNM
jgi:hypothetical protein